MKKLQIEKILENTINTYSNLTGRQIMKIDDGKFAFDEQINYKKELEKKFKNEIAGLLVYGWKEVDYDLSMLDKNSCWDEDFPLYCADIVSESSDSDSDSSSNNSHMLNTRKKKKKKRKQDEKSATPTKKSTSPTKTSPTKTSPPKNTKTSPPKTTKTSPPKTTKTSPPKTTKTSPPKTTKTSPPKTTKTSPTKSPPKKRQKVNDENQDPQQPQGRKVSQQPKGRSFGERSVSRHAADLPQPNRHGADLAFPKGFPKQENNNVTGDYVLQLKYRVTRYQCPAAVEGCSHTIGAYNAKNTMKEHFRLQHPNATLRIREQRLGISWNKQRKGK